MSVLNIRFCKVNQFNLKCVTHACGLVNKFEEGIQGYCVTGNQLFTIYWPQEPLFDLQDF